VGERRTVVSEGLSYRRVSFVDCFTARRVSQAVQRRMVGGEGSNELKTIQKIAVVTQETYYPRIFLDSRKETWNTQNTRCPAPYNNTHALCLLMLQGHVDALRLPKRLQSLYAHQRLYRGHLLTLSEAVFLPYILSVDHNSAFTVPHNLSFARYFCFSAAGAGSEVFIRVRKCL
jgi:hypothetical protein